MNGVSLPTSSAKPLDGDPSSVASRFALTVINLFAPSISGPSTRSSRRRQCFQFHCTSQFVDRGRAAGSVPSMRIAIICSGADPFFDCLDRIKGVRAIAPAAMVHPGSHEEAVEVPYAGWASHKIENAVVVVDAAKRGNRRTRTKFITDIKEALTNVGPERPPRFGKAQSAIADG